MPPRAHPKGIAVEGSSCILQEQLGQSACETLIKNRLLFTFQLCFWQSVRISSFLEGLLIPDEGAGVWGRPLVFITKTFQPSCQSLLTSPKHADNLIFQKHPPALPGLALLLECLTHPSCCQWKMLPWMQSTPQVSVEPAQGPKAMLLKREEPTASTSDS